MRDYATAARMLASVPEQVSERPESIGALARSYYHLGAQEKARTVLKKLLTHPAGAQGVLLGAQIADEMQDYDIAEELISVMPADSSNRTTLGYRLALVQYHAKRYEQSQRTLLDLVTAGYRTGKIFNLLGWCYQKQNQLQLAVQALEESIHLAPADESNYLDLERILFAGHLLPAALAVAKSTTSAFPDSARAFLMRGSIELKMSQFTDAVASYARAFQLDPAAPDGLLGLAESQFAAGMNNEAAAGFEDAIRRFPKDARFRVQYALMLVKEAETENAPADARIERLLRSALRLDPSLPEAHYQLGDLVLKKGHTTEALRIFEQAAELDPHSAKAHFALARVYRRLGRTEEAAREMDRYQKLHEAETPAATASPAGIPQK